MFFAFAQLGEIAARHEFNGITGQIGKSSLEHLAGAPDQMTRIG